MEIARLSGMSDPNDEKESNPDPISQAALEHFGIAYLFPYQRLVVAAVLDACCPECEGATVRQVVLLPTGAGKSLCFQLPSLLCPGPTLIVYPLLGLMSDQERRMKEREVRCAVLRGGMTKEERLESFRAISDGSARMIITNPETLCMPGILEFLKTAGIFHFVIDEAHCVAEWGDSFRPAYLELGRLIQELKPRITTAFTATASPPVLERVAHCLFGNEPYGLISGNPDRPNIRYEVLRSLSLKQSLRASIARYRKPTIVFASSRPGVQILAEDLKRNFPDTEIRFYHAGLEREEKKQVEAWFMNSGSGILCATCAYGMGMDKSNIRTVIHYSLPSSVEAYLQEAGRAGRDGKPSTAILLALALRGDRMTTEAPSGGDVGEMRKKIFREYAHQNEKCRRSILLKALGSGDEPCSGCDVCDKTAAEQPDGHREILDAIRENPRRFSVEKAVSFLHGKRGIVKAAGFGSLEKWHKDEIEEALLGEITLGYVDQRKKSPWKGALKSAGKSNVI